MKTKMEERMETMAANEKERTLEEIKRYCAEQVDTLWEEVTRFENPHQYYVDLSPALWDIKNRMIEENTALSQR